MIIHLYYQVDWSKNFKFAGFPGFSPTKIFFYHQFKDVLYSFLKPTYRNKDSNII